jgi:TetR/AcrR family transcriptional regulator
MEDKSDAQKLSRKEREYQIRRGEILQAAAKLFGTKGYHATTMNEIAKEAEFSTGSLYNFFNNKEELYFSLLYEKVEELEGFLKGVKEMSGTARARFERMVEIILDYFEKEKDFFKVFAVYRDSFFEATLRGDFAQQIRTKFITFIEDLASVAEEGISGGEFRCFSGQEIAMTFMAIIHSFLAMWIESEQEYSVREKKDVIMDIFFHGIFNPEQPPALHSYGGGARSER